MSALHRRPCRRRQRRAWSSSEAPYPRTRSTLLVDVGTNAEIVLGNRERLLACSSPTGPAFEGAQISSGQRAAPGAIERVRIDPVTLEPRYKVIGSDLWSDEPGFDEATAATGVTGICGSGIIEAIAEMFLAGIITPDGVVDGALAARTPRIEADGRTFSYVVREGEPRIAVTQNDVRAIQLAKAALYAGVALLMDHYGVDARRPHHARRRLRQPYRRQAMRWSSASSPTARSTRSRSAGNAAGTGARIALLNAAARERDRGGGAPHREDRDGGRAAVPGTFRRGHGDSAQDRPVPPTSKLRSA